MFLIFPSEVAAGTIHQCGNFNPFFPLISFDRFYLSVLIHRFTGSGSFILSILLILSYSPFRNRGIWGHIFLKKRVLKAFVLILIMQEMDWRTGVNDEMNSKEVCLINFDDGGEPALLVQQPPQQQPPQHLAQPASQNNIFSNLQNQVMDTNIENKLDLGHMYKQCKIAKARSQTVITTNFASEQGFTVDEPQKDRIGNLDCPADTDVLKTFHGARISKGGRVVNECISLSFDPRSFDCLGCKKPHSIKENVPVTICFSDQNFVPFIQNGKGGCIGIVRLEDATLSDLVDICFEIFDKYEFPAGSVIMFGSASYLFRVGVSLYTQNLIENGTRIGSRWRNVHYCPLIPILRESGPGSLARELEQLAAWIIRVYATNIDGLVGTWEALLNAVQGHSIGNTPLQNTEHINVPLPANYGSSTLRPHTFSYTNSCPILLNGFDPRVMEVLIRILTASLKQNFGTVISPDHLVPRADASGQDTRILINHVVVLGASNAKRLVPVLEGFGLTVTDLSRPGWLATEENIAALINELKKLNLPPGFGVVMDLLGNATFRFEQFDGSTALPYKDLKGWHYAGRITVCPESNFKQILTALTPIFMSAQDNLKVILPPMPRYISGSCCANLSHGTNVGEEGYGIEILDKLTGLRGLMKKNLKDIGLKNFWLLDGIAAVLGISPPEIRGHNRDIVADLSEFIGPDNVHLTDAGKKNVATVIGRTLISLRDGKLGKDCCAISVSGTGTRVKSSHFWRGFVSPIGSAPAPEQLRKFNNRHHPYTATKHKKKN
jgi:hypothetical protein